MTEVYDLCMQPQPQSSGRRVLPVEGLELALRQLELDAGGVAVSLVSHLCAPRELVVSSLQQIMRASLDVKQYFLDLQMTKTDPNPGLFKPAQFTEISSPNKNAML